MTSSSDVRDIAEEVARATVKEFFLALGVNADDPDAVIAVQKDFAHLRAWREASDTIKRKGLGTAVTIVVTGLLGLVWLALSRH
ncbi:hypothetical protein [Bradyrhizobium prioriisuperbiae]|uniref:hypothetical protein n=1 Tax=Bradyrhizobium prioriisuperbiae TaxID=2854389 RepID=UPI0028EF491C|nr:hypothetical protein [Bradyrhizobium prioritasuperba]